MERERARHLPLRNEGDPEEVIFTDSFRPRLARLRFVPAEFAPAAELPGRRHIRLC